MNKKYQIFVSSTYLDLIDERKKIANAVTKADHIAVGMELFPASTLKQWEMIKGLIDESDYYILIIGARYGSTAPILSGEENKEISYTQKEYEYAFKKGIPIYTFFIEHADSLPPEKQEKTSKGQAKLKSFKKLIKSNGYYYEYWENADELSRKVLNALNHAFNNTPRPGWIRSDNLVNIAVDYNSDLYIKEKLIYYKFLHLSDREDGVSPIYKKYIKRLDREEEVFDEYLTFRVNDFSKLVKKFRSYDSTKGTAVEVNSLLPFIMSLRDTDVTVQSNPQIVQPVIYGPSQVFITSSHYYNGFQYKNRDTAVKADKDCQVVRMVVDFSSVPDYKRFISDKPKVFFRFHDTARAGKLVDKLMGNAIMLSPGIYYAEIKDMKEDEVLRIEFSNDYETISNIS